MTHLLRIIGKGLVVAGVEFPSGENYKLFVIEAIADRTLQHANTVPLPCLAHAGPATS